MSPGILGLNRKWIADNARGPQHDFYGSVSSQPKARSEALQVRRAGAEGGRQAYRARAAQRLQGVSLPVSRQRKRQDACLGPVRSARENRRNARFSSSFRNAVEVQYQ